MNDTASTTEQNYPTTARFCNIIPRETKFMSRTRLINILVHKQSGLINSNSLSKNSKLTVEHTKFINRKNIYIVYCHYFKLAYNTSCFFTNITIQFNFYIVHFPL